MSAPAAPDGEPPRKRSRWDTGGDAQGSAPAVDGNGTGNGSATTALLGGSAQALSLSSDLQDAKLAAQEALAKRAAVLQQNISGIAGLAGASGLPSAPKPPMVTLDAQGRLLDERGKEIRAGGAGSHAPIKLNQVARSNPLLSAAAQVPDVTSNKYFDPRMAVPGAGREQRLKRAFNFVSEGHFSKRADELRAKAAVEQMLRDAPSRKSAPNDAHFRAHWHARAFCRPAGAEHLWGCCDNVPVDAATTLKISAAVYALYGVLNFPDIGIPLIDIKRHPMQNSIFYNDVVVPMTDSNKGALRWTGGTFPDAFRFHQHGSRGLH